MAGLAIPPAASADQGEYRLLQCHGQWPHTQEVTVAGDATHYEARNQCGTADRRLELVQSGGVSGGNYKQFVLLAPAGTKLTYACLDHNLRRDNNSRPEIVTF